MHYFSSKKNILFVLIMLLCFVAKAQDTLVMRSGKSILSKIIEVTPTEVKFKKLDNIGGPVYTEDKLTVSEIKYSNGAILTFESRESLKEKEIEEFIRTYPQNTWGDFVNFNIEAGFVLNESLCNLPKVETDKYTRGFKPSSHELIESRRNDSYYMRYSFGVGLQFYNNPYIKPIMALNYLESVGSFEYRYLDHSNQSIYYQIEGVEHSIARYINVYIGFRTIVLKHINIDLCHSINFPFSTSNKISGTETKSYYEFNGQYYYVARKETNDVVIKNRDIYMKTSLSFSPKISYTFKLQERKIGIYVSRNLPFFSNSYLPWWMAGFIYYPFKKLQ